ncbi:MAG: histidinol dehydrogenase [Microbacterium sp.]
MQQLLMKALTWLGALIAGAVFGIAGTICYASLVLRFPVGSIEIALPIGLALAAIACFALLLAIRLLADDRGAVFAAGLGMLAALFLFSSRGPGGSVVVPQAAEGELPLGLMWAWTLAIVIVLVAAWPDLRRIRAQQASSRVPESAD